MGIESHRHGNETARRRWGLLARALQNNNRSSTTTTTTNSSSRNKDKFGERSNDKQDLISVRRISNFGLITIIPIDSIEWFLYRVNNYEAKVKHLNLTLTPENLMGFNNTGNVCVWPSEEVLAYYALANLSYFDGKKVLELGAGMSALAGVYIAKYSACSLITLTDGNQSSVDNIKDIVEENNLDDKKVNCSLLRWGEVTDVSYDIILAADCLFFDTTRKDLVHTMWHSMNKGGSGLVTAPRRGTTLDKFVEEASNCGFKYCVSDCYNQDIWKRHTELMRDCPYYDCDIHFPVFILLTKTL
ncbi:hypothetical protein O3M35_007947 [Rhynocoris fuscipes]|uniref:Calmodulin-lysine N-methyltransferase n=1 Tax=Rhynocoris fuscipes TaxID=488301 RepID=A0AAW1DCT4_9HEMI